jgi:hypothetical protein
MRAKEDADMASLRKQGVNVIETKLSAADERRFAAMKDDSAALEKFRAEKAKRASDEAYLLAEADKFDKLTPQKQAERDRIKQMKADADRDWDSMSKGKEGQKSPANAEQAKETYSKEQSTEQTSPKDKKKSNDAAAAAPQVTPADVTKENVPPPTVIIDVVKDFDWTSSINKQQVGEKVPFIRLTEFKLTANNALNGLAAAAMAFADINRSTMAGVAKLGNVASTITQSTFMQSAGDAAKTGGDAVGAAGAAIEPYLKQAEDYIKSKTNDSFGPEGQHLMDLFGNLYAREATGRTYVLPHYTKDYFQTSNDFSDTTQPLIKGLYEGLDAAGQIPSLFTTGVYVQRPKFYQFASAREPSVNITLTLYNTMTPMSYLKHTKFIQQLSLSNLPRRVTRAIVEPPCIYEVLIPGEVFYPYCYINRLQITNVGTRRMINNEVVPDAYQIDISLTSLIKDANNLYEKQMQHHGMTFSTPTVEKPAASSKSPAAPPAASSKSGEQRNAKAGQPAQTAPSNPTPVVDNRDKVIPMDRNGNATDGSGDSIYNYINKPGASPKFIVPPENKPMFIKPKPTSQSFGVEG